MGATVLWEELNRRSFAALFVVACLLAAVPVQASTAGIKPGDAMTFDYTILTTYSSPNGNVTDSTSTSFQVLVTSVNVTGSLGQFGYTESLLEFNTTVLQSGTSADNFTTFFNPYDNQSYTGNIGFWPVIYTDVKSGTIKDLELSETYTQNTTSGVATYVADEYVNATIWRSDGLIDLNMSLKVPSGSSTPLPAVQFRIQYNGTTGVMQSYAEYANIYGSVEKILSYNLVGFSETKLPSYNWVGYVVLAAAIAVVAYAVVTRKSGREKKVARLREKYTKR